MWVIYLFHMKIISPHHWKFSRHAESGQNSGGRRWSWSSSSTNSFSSCSCLGCSEASCFLKLRSWGLVCTSWCPVCHQISHCIQDKVLPYRGQSSSGCSCSDTWSYPSSSSWQWLWSFEGSTHYALFSQQLSEIWSSCISSFKWRPEAISPHEQDARAPSGWLQVWFYPLWLVPPSSFYWGLFVREGLGPSCFSSQGRWTVPEQDLFPGESPSWTAQRCSS